MKTLYYWNWLRVFVRSSHRSCSVGEVALRNLAKFTGKHLCQSLFFDKVVLRPVISLKRRIWHSCFSVNFAKFFRTLFFIEHLQSLLLKSVNKKQKMSSQFPYRLKMRWGFPLNSQVCKKCIENLKSSIRSPRSEDVHWTHKRCLEDVLNVLYYCLM